MENKVSSLASIAFFSTALWVGAATQPAFSAQSSSPPLSADTFAQADTDNTNPDDSRQNLGAFLKQNGFRGDTVEELIKAMERVDRALQRRKELGYTDNEVLDGLRKAREETYQALNPQSSKKKSGSEGNYGGTGHENRFGSLYKTMEGTLGRNLQVLYGALGGIGAIASGIFAREAHGLRLPRFLRRGDKGKVLGGFLLAVAASPVIVAAWNSGSSVAQASLCLYGPAAAINFLVMLKISPSFTGNPWQDLVTKAAIGTASVPTVAIIIAQTLAFMVNN